MDVDMELASSENDDDEVLCCGFLTSSILMTTMMSVMALTLRELVHVDLDCH